MCWPVVHDEAHLEPAFQQLLETVRREQTRCREFAEFRVMELTATTRSNNKACSDAGNRSRRFNSRLKSRIRQRQYRIPRRTNHPFAQSGAGYEPGKNSTSRKAVNDTKIAEQIADIALVSSLL